MFAFDRQSISRTKKKKKKYKNCSRQKGNNWLFCKIPGRHSKTLANIYSSMEGGGWDVPIIERKEYFFLYSNLHDFFLLLLLPSSLLLVNKNQCWFLLSTNFFFCSINAFVSIHFNFRFFFLNLICIGFARDDFNECSKKVNIDFEVEVKWKKNWRATLHPKYEWQTKRRGLVKWYQCIDCGKSKQKRKKK